MERELAVPLFTEREAAVVRKAAVLMRASDLMTPDERQTLFAVADRVERGYTNATEGVR